MSFRMLLDISRTLVSLILYLIVGGMIIASFYGSTPRYILGSVFVIVALPTLVSHVYNERRLQRARAEYTEIQSRYGYSAREHCPHRFFSLSQKDIGVIAMTDKWCKICGKQLGPATLRKSVFGNQWV